MTKRAPPASSWLTMPEPASACLCQTRFARSAIVSCGRAWKIETCRSRCVLSKGGRSGSRSEEHTSELQSRLHLVCRLLLEKKKNKTTKYYLSVAANHE